MNLSSTIKVTSFVHLVTINKPSPESKQHNVSPFDSSFRLDPKPRSNFFFFIIVQKERLAEWYATHDAASKGKRRKSHNSRIAK